MGDMGSAGLAVTRLINYYNYLHGDARDIGDEDPGGA